MRGSSSCSLRPPWRSSCSSTWAWRSYQPLRQTLLTIPMAVALGVGFARYLDHQTDLLFWGVVLGYSAVGLVATIVGARRSST